MRAPLSRVSSRIGVLPALLAAGIMLLAVIGGISVWLVDRARDNAALVAATLESEAKLADLLLELRRAESGQRGYLLTNEPEYLAPYVRAVDAVPAIVADLRSRLGQDGEQRPFLDQIESGIAEKLAELERSIRTQREGDAAGATASSPPVRHAPSTAITICSCSSTSICRT